MTQVVSKEHKFDYLSIHKNQHRSGCADVGSTGQSSQKGIVDDTNRAEKSKELRQKDLQMHL